MSGWIRVRHADHGGEATVDAAAERFWSARGWEVIAGPADSQSELEPDEDEAAPPATPDTPAAPATDETTPAAGSEDEEK